MLPNRLNSTAQYDLSQKSKKKKEGGATGRRALKPFILVSPKLTVEVKSFYI